MNLFIDVGPLRVLRTLNPWKKYKVYSDMCYKDCCRLLNWQTLEKRREFLSLVQCYKIVSGVDSLSFSGLF